MSHFFTPLFCDNHVAIFVKPHGMTVQMDGYEKDEETLQFHAKMWIKEKYNKPGGVFLEPIHRIDKPVHGLVLFARTSKALSRMQEMMRNREIGRRYLALVSGSPKMREATLNHTIIHGDHRAHLSQDGKLATLHYKTVEERNGKTLLEIELDTGRYHQIRLQLSTIGYPVIGDSKYGSKITLAEGQIALQSYKLTFPHPITREMLTFTAPLPPFLN